jgi:hypothetical protein
MKCPNCGASASDGKGFCQYCGVEIEVSANQTIVSGVKCPECGTVNSPDVAKCHKCGKTLFRICSRCRNRIYLMAEHCGRCGLSTESSGFSSNLSERTELAGKLANEGKYLEAERILSELRDQDFNAPSLLLLGEVKLGRLRSMVSDVRFVDSIERTRTEAKIALTKAVDLAPDSTEADRARMLLEKFSERKRTHDYKPIIVIVMIVIVVLLVVLGNCNR